MTDHKENIDHPLEVILFMVLFLFFALSFSDKSDYRTLDRGPYSFQHELETGFQKSNLNAVIIESIKCPAVPITEILLNTLSDKCSGLLNERYRIAGDTRIFSRRIKIFQNILYKTEPLSVTGYNIFHFTSSDTEDLPVLS